MASGLAKHTSIEYNRNPSDVQLDDLLSGKNALVVGGTKGIGAAVAELLAQHGCNVTIVGRSDGTAIIDRMQEASKQCGDPKGVQSFAFRPIDCSLVANARQFARNYAEEHAWRGLDILVFAIAASPKVERTGTREGVEVNFATGYLSRFVILQELLPWLETRAARARVLNLCLSPDRLARQGINWGDVQRAEMRFCAKKAHALTAVANDLMVKYVSQHKKSVDIFGINRAVLDTDARKQRHIMASAVATCMVCLGGRQTLSAFAQRIVNIAASPELRNRSGACFDPFGTPSKPNPFVAAQGNAERMQMYSESLVKSVGGL